MTPARHVAGARTRTRSDGIGSVKVGNQVSVFASVSGSKATATSITDMTLLQQGRGPMSFGWSSAS